MEGLTYDVVNMTAAEKIAEKNEYRSKMRKAEKINE